MNTVITLKVDATEAIDSQIISATYTVLPSGKCMICELVLKNGFSVTGESSVMSKSNFREDLGRKYSYEKARNKIWELEGYALQQKLYENPSKHSS